MLSTSLAGNGLMHACPETLLQPLQALELL